VNVDEFEHTEVEQRARRDQQRVLAALARHIREHRRDPEVQREGNDVTQAAFQSPYAQDGDDAADPASGYCGPGPETQRATTTRRRRRRRRRTRPPCPVERRRWHRYQRCRESADPRHRRQPPTMDGIRWMDRQ
jgi:hypothetical protein